MAKAMTKAVRKGQGELAPATVVKGQGEPAPAKAAEQVRTGMYETMRVRLTFTEEVLGTLSPNPDVFTDYIASKRPEGVDDAEAQALPELDDVITMETTVFPRTGDGRLFLYDYQILGFFKDACGALRRCDPKEFASPGLKAYKKIIDGCIFIKDRQNPLVLPEGGETGICERPLRAQTAQGERIALARSETVPAGTTLEFTVILLNSTFAGVVQEWLNYGMFRGIGQWRNSGKGRFTWEDIDG